MLSKNSNTLFNRKLRLEQALILQEGDRLFPLEIIKIFSDKDLCGIILEHLSDQDFIAFGQTCCAFHDIITLNPRYNLIRETHGIKLLHYDVYYQNIYDSLHAKYREERGLNTTPWSPIATYQNITDWSKEALACLIAVNNSMLKARLSSLQRRNTIIEIDKLKRILSMVIPGSTIDFTAFNLRLRKLNLSDLNDPIIHSLQKLINVVNSLPAPNQASFRRLCGETHTSFFGDLYTLLEMAKLNFQLLNKEIKTPALNDNFIQHRNTTTTLMHNIQTHTSWNEMLFGRYGWKMVTMAAIPLLFRLLYPVYNSYLAEKPYDKNWVDKADNMIKLLLTLMFILFAYFIYSDVTRRDELRQHHQRRPQIAPLPTDAQMDEIERGHYAPNI